MGTRKKKREPDGWYAYAPLSGAVFELAGNLGEADIAALNEPSRGADGKRSIRFFPEYCAEYPFWEDGEIDGADLGLSPKLDKRSREFMQFWESHFSPDDGWDTAGNEQTWDRMGDLLLRDLEAELAGTEFTIVDERY